MHNFKHRNKIAKLYLIKAMYQKKTIEYLFFWGQCNLWYLWKLSSIMEIVKIKPQQKHEGKPKMKTNLRVWKPKN